MNNEDFKKYLQSIDVKNGIDFTKIKKYIIDLGVGLDAESFIMMKEILKQDIINETALYKGDFKYKDVKRVFIVQLLDSKMSNKIDVTSLYPLIDEIAGTEDKDAGAKIEKLSQEYIKLFMRHCKEGRQKKIEEYEIAKPQALNNGNIEHYIKLCLNIDQKVTEQNLSKAEAKMQEVIVDIAKGSEEPQVKEEKFLTQTHLRLDQKQQAKLQDIFKSYKSLNDKNWLGTITELIKDILSKVLHKDISDKAKLNKENKNLISSITASVVPNTPRSSTEQER
jgi:hypothetical protein